MLFLKNKYTTNVNLLQCLDTIAMKILSPKIQINEITCVQTSILTLKTLEIHHCTQIFLQIMLIEVLKSCGKFADVRAYVKQEGAKELVAVCYKFL